MKVKQDKGLVSIITPTYNCGRFISETIESVLAQTYGNWEMLIIDDCSSDNTREIVETYTQKDARIKYHCLEANSGAAIARNTGLKMAKGRWIAFLDSDDLWAPGKLDRQLDFMISNDYAFSYHEYHEISETGEDLNLKVSGLSKVGRYKMLTCCWPGCLAVMYDHNKIGLLQIASVKKNNDTALWLKAVRKAPCYLLKEDLARYRRRQGSLTPPTISQKIWAHYPLFRDSEKMPPAVAVFWTLMNVVGNSYKKLFYIKKIRNK